LVVHPDLLAFGLVCKAALSLHNSISTAIRLFLALPISRHPPSVHFAFTIGLAVTGFADVGNAARIPLPMGELAADDTGVLDLDQWLLAGITVRIRTIWRWLL
jgi:hypothetical protein